MFPEQDINRHNYQLHFLEMENKIKKCELERAQLEQNFSQLMRERQECERATARSLKQKYKRMMEMEHQRAEKNESLLRMLHKIDQQAASLAAKTDRLKMLKTQYESYLMRSWSSPRALTPSPVQAHYSQPQQFFATASHPGSFAFPARATESPKSEFVKYLSDMTHIQTAAHNPIPPPMALSNYISNQQMYQQPQQQYPSSYGSVTPTWTQDQFLKSPLPEEASASSFQKSPLPEEASTSSNSYNPVSSSQHVAPMVPPTPHRSIPAVQTNKKFELSNEEFIQYIDNEILKGSAPTIMESNPTPGIVIEPPTVPQTPIPTAYLEDVATDEDIYEETRRYYDSSPIMEEITGTADKLNLNSDTLKTEYPIPLLSDNDATINQRWEKIVEVNSDVREPVLVADVVVDEEQNIPITAPLQNVVQETLRGVISEVEVRRATPPVSERTETTRAVEFDAEQTNVPHELPQSTAENEPPLNSAVLEENHLEYQQDYAPETDYQEQKYLSKRDYQPVTDPYRPIPPSERTAPEAVEYIQNYSPTTEQQQLPASTPASHDQADDPNYWSTARQAVKSKNYVGLNQSRTPETIEEVVDNGELDQRSPSAVISSPVEKRSTPSGSKRNSPTGENVSPTEIHASKTEPDAVSEQQEEPMAEPQPTETEVDPTSYDYSQYQAEYDQTGDQQQAYQYQQDGTDQQYYQYEGQSGQDESQAQGYQEYAEGTGEAYTVDPNQYQQATEYPGPTQYVFEQSYYDQEQQEQQPQEQQYDQNQQAYYDPNVAVDQQYYSEEQQHHDPNYYEQSQAYEPYPASDTVAAGDSVQEEPITVSTLPEDEKSSKMEIPVEEVSPASIGASESVSDKLPEQKKSDLAVPAVPETAEDKNDTTISSANDESDFDFSTQ